MSRGHQNTNVALWNVDTKKIMLLSSLVVVPMITFTITMLAFVFSNKIDLNGCPDPGLCPYIGNAGPANSSHYYVEFPVGRLAFISSLSSTISFALLAVMMSMYGYVVASQILDASQGSNGRAALPTPLGMTELIRLLNAEITLLWDILVGSYHRIKQSKRNSRGNQIKAPRVLRICRIVFMLIIAASVLIQVTDTYLHIVTESISATLLSMELGSEHQLSRSLGPRVLDVTDQNDPKLFWGAAVTVEALNGANVVNIVNRSAYLSVGENIDPYLLNYTDAKGISYSLIKSPYVDMNLDWAGTGYGVSTQCSAIPRDRCHIGGNLTTLRWPFQCLTSTALGNITGHMTTSVHETWTYEWHRYLRETQPFEGTEEDGVIALKVLDELDDNAVANMTKETTNALFRNPWHFLAKTSVIASELEMPESFLKNSVVQKNAFNSSILILVCNTTVYDTSYKVVQNNVVSLNTTKSNGTVAGIASMPSLASIGLMTMGRGLVQIMDNLTTPEAWIKSYELSISKQISIPLVLHTIPAPATLAQRRNTAVITRLPKAALWLLVVANLLFAVFGCVLATLAMKATSPEVHQVHVRLSTAGLAAQLFDASQAQHRADNDKGLFRETIEEHMLLPGKRTCMKHTAHGGVEYFTHDATDGALLEADSEMWTLRQTHTL